MRQGGSALVTCPAGGRGRQVRGEEVRRRGDEERGQLRAHDAPDGGLEDDGARTAFIDF